MLAHRVRVFDYPDEKEINEWMAKLNPLSIEDVIPSFRNEERYDAIAGIKTTRCPILIIWYTVYEKEVQ